MRIFFYFMISMLPLCNSKVFADNDIKALILIVADGDEPIFFELQKIWREYMHSDPDHIEVYFIKANPNLPSKVQTDGDTIWCQTSVGMDGIIVKTLYAIEHLLPDIQNKFDFVMRTNLSTFCIFPRFLNYLKTLPKTGCFSGNRVNGWLASGTGLIFSSDIAELLAANQDTMINRYDSSWLEDVRITYYLESQSIPLINHNLIWYYNRNGWEGFKRSSDIFQVRVKGDIRGEKRMPADQIIHSDLLDMFY